jgi:hypothetical protein
MHTKLFKLTALLLLSFVQIQKGNAQNVDTAISRYKANTQFEKLYLHFDNSKYAAGQTIWYKAYLMNGFQSSLISKNCYIDWYDDNGILLSSTITPIVYSYSSGSFTLPENLKSKSVHAVAYTMWMRNFDSTYFFNQTFPIVTRNESNNIALETNEASIQFLPESGILLANKLNTIAFKAINKMGLPAQIVGVIKNSKGDSITSFKSVHDGMGKFFLTPMTNEYYTAVWKDQLGILHKTDLPKAEEIGVNLQLETGRSNRVFRVQRTKNAPEQLKVLQLVGQMNGNILFKANLNLSDKESIISSLPISKLSSGILQLTVFDANEQPVCERVVFVKNEDYVLKTDLLVDTLSTVKRGRNVIEIELKDSTYSNYSLSITDAGTSDAPNQTIASQLLLTSDVTGHIFKPAYYFTSNADSVNNHLDLVMLTNGWRRYIWKEILANTLPAIKYQKDIGYQTISGKITGYDARKIKKPETINLIFVAKDSSNNMLVLPILEDGSFESKNAMMYDTTKVYYKINGTTTVTDKNIQIQNDLFKVNPNLIQLDPSPSYDTLGAAKLQLLILEQNRMDSIKKRNTLKEVTVFAKQKARIKELDKKYTFGFFSGEAAAAFDLSTFENASHTIDIYDFLTGKVPGLVIGKTIGGTATQGVVEYRGATPSFYLNEMPIQASDLPSIVMSDVAYVKLFNPPFIGGLNPAASSTETAITEKSTGVGGARHSASNVTPSGAAIAIYTKRGGDLNYTANNLKSNLSFKSLVGYAPVKEFYTPNYAEKAQMDNNTQDLRSTILWNPWINLDKSNQKMKFVFYNNDISTSFRVVLEGMDSKGRLVHISKILK